MSLNALVLASQKSFEHLQLPHNHVKADLILVFVTLLAAAGWIFSKEAINGFTPLLFIGVRFTLAGMLLAIIGYNSLKVVSARELVRMSLVGVVFSIALMIWITALHLGDSLGVGAFLNSLGVIMVPIVAMLFGDKVPRAIWYSLPPAIIGLACLALDGELGFGYVEGLFLLSALIFALYFNLNGRAAMKVSAIALTSVQLMVVGVVALMGSVLTEQWPESISFESYAWLSASILLATSWRFLLQTKAQSLAPPSHAAVIMVLEPVWTALLAIVWLDEQMTQLQLLGCVLILSALVLSRGPMFLGWLKPNKQQPQNG